MIRIAINFAASKSSFDSHTFENFKKTVTRTPVTKTTSNITGNETLTDGTPDATYECILYRQEDDWAQDKPGLFQGADVVIIIKTSQTINKNDKIGYSGETYRIDKVVTRRFNEQAFWQTARGFKI